jgi:hypothetical protein
MTLVSLSGQTVLPLDWGWLLVNRTSVNAAVGLVQCVQKGDSGSL